MYNCFNLMYNIYKIHDITNKRSDTTYLIFNKNICIVL